jgi:hypothetical protein
MEETMARTSWDAERKSELWLTEGDASSNTHSDGQIGNKIQADSFGGRRVSFAQD